jgi:hypothetical protein
MSIVVAAYDDSNRYRAGFGTDPGLPNAFLATYAMQFGYNSGVWLICNLHICAVHMPQEFSSVSTALVPIRQDFKNSSEHLASLHFLLFRFVMLLFS